MLDSVAAVGTLRRPEITDMRIGQFTGFSLCPHFAPRSMIFASLFARRAHTRQSGHITNTSHIHGKLAGSQSRGDPPI